MRVAYIIGGLPFGGVESWLFDLAHALKAGDQVEPVIINVSGTGLRHQEFIDSGLRVLNAGGSTSCLNTHRLDTAWRVRRLLGQIRPDLIHTLHFTGDYFGRLAALGTGIPVVTHLRNVKRETKTVRRTANKLLSYATDRYLAVSRATADVVERDHNLAGRPVEVLYNALNLDKLAVPPHPLTGMARQGDPVVVAVGRLVEQKRYDFLLHVFARVRKTVRDARLIILGEGGKRGELEALIGQLGLEGAAFLPGFTDNVAAYLRAAHVFAMPSLYEGFPIAHIEAMACGLPAVISEHVPSREVCGESSFVLPLDEEAFAERLRDLLTDDALHGRMAAAAVEASRAFTLDKHLERLLAIYRALKRQA